MAEEFRTTHEEDETNSSIENGKWFSYMEKTQTALLEHTENIFNKLTSEIDSKIERLNIQVAGLEKRQKSDRILTWIYVAIAFSSVVITLIFHFWK